MFLRPPMLDPALPRVALRGISTWNSTSSLALWWAKPAAARNRRWASSGGSSVAQGVSFETTVRAGRNGRLVELVAHMPPDQDSDCSTSSLPPSPKDLVMAGLAACTSMTIQTRARAMVSSGKLEADALQQVRVHALDLTPAGQHMPDGVSLKVEFVGTLTAAQRRQLLAAAAACPVKRMLQGQMPEGVATSEVSPRD